MKHPKIKRPDLKNNQKYLLYKTLTFGVAGHAVQLAAFPGRSVASALVHMAGSDLKRFCTIFISCFSEAEITDEFTISRHYATRINGRLRERYFLFQLYIQSTDLKIWLCGLSILHTISYIHSLALGLSFYHGSSFDACSTREALKG